MTPKHLGALGKTVVAIVLAMLTGCATVTSHPQGRETPAHGEQAGLTYYLPMRYAEVTFERRFIAAKPSKSIEEARAEQKAAEAKFAMAAQKFSLAGERVREIRASGVPNTSETFQKLVLEEIEAKLEYNQAEKEAVVAKGAVAKTIADLQAWDTAQAQCGYLDRFSVTLQKPVADQQARLSLKMKHYPTRTDHWSYATTASGLLSTVNGEVKDETAEIIIALARSAVPFRTGVPEFAGSRMMARSSGPKIRSRRQDPNDPCNLDWKPLLIQRTFDPSIESEWKDFFGEIDIATNVACKPGKACNLTLGDVDYRLAPGFAGKPKQQTFDTNNGNAGIYYRRELPLSIRIENGTKFAGAFLLLVPNHSPNDLMPLEASPFVTTGHKLGFDNGILVSVDSKRPSGLLRAAAIPWDVASATIGAMTELVRFRVDYAKGNTDLVEQQVKLLEQLRDQLEAQQALEAARLSGAADDAAPSPQ